MRKMRFGAMVVTVVLAVTAFVGAQRMAWIPGPWSKQKRFEARTAETYTAAIAADPDNYMVYYRRGVTYKEHGQYEKALADLNEAVRLSPETLTAEQLGERAFNTRLTETHTMNLVVLARVARGEVLQALNRPDEALMDFDKAITTDFRNLNVLYARGMLRAVTGHYDAALADFNALLDRRASPDWLFGRGFASYLKGDWVAAAQDFQRLATLSPANSNILVWLTKAQLRSGNPILPAQRAVLTSHSEAAPIIDAYMADHDAHDFVAGVLAGASAAPGNKRQRQCETALFLGEWLTLHDDGKGARDMFVQAETTCVPLSLEHATAAAELKRPTALVKAVQ